jgi:two-component system, NtrC family, response regulator HydG
MAKILLVDDDPQALASTRRILEHAGHQIVCAKDGQEAFDLIRPSAHGKKIHFDLIVSDVRMPRFSGMELLEALNACQESVPFILITAYGRVEEAVWALKYGAVDFLTKPFKRKALLEAVQIGLLRSQRVSSQQEIKSSEKGLSQLVGSSLPMEELKTVIGRVAPTDAAVLLSGESGTGKEVCARAIHDLSKRSHRSFVALNCAAIPEQLMESELFGYEKGAFSGAQHTKLGIFEMANEGTLLLDEIGDLPLHLQGKLLRVLQEGEVRRLGATRTQKIDVRVISASHRNLKERVQVEEFREDLLFRLEVVGIRVPALRDRLDDLPELTRALLVRAAKSYGRKSLSITPDAVEILQSYTWPGNVRELNNVLERAVVFAKGDQVCPEDLPPHLLEFVGKTTKAFSNMGAVQVQLGTPLREVEALLIRKTLEATSGDKNMTARLLGINSRTIYRRLGRKDQDPEV